METIPNLCLECGQIPNSSCKVSDCPHKQLKEEEQLNPISIEQPTPKFTLIDLDRILETIYTRTIKATQFSSRDVADDLRRISLQEANSALQGLVVQVAKNIRDLESIDMPLVENKKISETFQVEKPAFNVCGVQLFENKKLVGTSLYSTIVKARIIRDTLNKEFARLRVNHEAKIINYPVF